MPTSVRLRRPPPGRRGTALSAALSVVAAGAPSSAGERLGSDPHAAGRLAAFRWLLGGGAEGLVVDAHRVNFLLLRLRRAREPRPSSEDDRDQDQREAPRFGEAFRVCFFGQLEDTCTGTFGNSFERVELESGRPLPRRAEQQHRSRLAGGARHREQGGGDDPAGRRREDDRQHAAPAGDAERVGGFALGARGRASAPPGCRGRSAAPR